MKISDMFDSVGEGVLTEDSKKLLTEAFNTAVETTVRERLDLELKNALTKLDEEHSQKLEQLLEAIDKDHSGKLMAVLEKIDEDHVGKMQDIIKRNQKILNEDAKEFKTSLIEKLSNYIDLYIEKSIPREELKEAVENKKAQKMLTHMKQIISLDDSFINDTIKEAVSDGRKTIDTLKEELNEAIKNNIKLSNDLKSTKADLVLEKRTTGLSKDKKDYVMRMLHGKDPEYITENFSYIIKMFDKEDDDNKQVIKESAEKTTTTLKNKVDTVPKKVITENVNSNSGDEEVGGYLSELKRFDRFTK